MEHRRTAVVRVYWQLMVSGTIWYKVWALLPSDVRCSSWLLSFLYLLIVESEGTLSGVQTPSFTSFFRICGALNAGSYCCICLIISGEVPLAPGLARAGAGCDPLVSGVPVQTECGVIEHSFGCNQMATYIKDEMY